MAGKIKTYVLDACALITFLRKEKGHEKLLTLFKENQIKFLMHAVNLGEVYYDTLRFCNKKQAHELFADIAQLPVNVVWILDTELLELAGKYKTGFSMSYADTFVLALAEREEAIVISTDHSEFDAVEKSGAVSFYWLR